MPERNDAVREMVRRQLRRRNPPDTKALYGRAVRIEPSIRGLDLRQFNARYVLPVRNEQKCKEGLTEGDERRVRGLVKRRLVENPEVSVDALFDEARNLASSLKRLGRRAFAKAYVNPLKQELAGHGSRPTVESRPRIWSEDRSAESRLRDVVRQVLYGLAAEMAAAQKPSDVVTVVASVDSYVARVLDENSAS